MNKILTICFLLFFHFVNGSDTLQKKIEKQELCINQKTPILIQVNEPSKTKSPFEIFYAELKDWFPSLITIGGVIAGYFLIRRKLIEKHISTALEDIQKANEKIMIECTRLLDECIPKSYENLSLNKEDLQNELEKVKTIYLTAQTGSSECQTLLFYLKFTIQETLVHYPGEGENFTKILYFDFYVLMIETLESVVFYARQVVTIPKSTRTKSISFLKPKYTKFTTGSKYTTYKHFNLGFINDPHSALFLTFISRINYSYNTLLKRSAFKLFRNSDMLFIMMHSRKIYAPLKIELPKNLARNNAEYDLYLIGYEILDKSYQNETKKSVRLIYSNPNDSFRFLKRSVKIGEFQKYEDAMIRNSGFELSKGELGNYEVFESVSIDFDFNYLQNLFSKNKWQIRKKLPAKRGVNFWMSKLRRR